MADIRGTAPSSTTSIDASDYDQLARKSMTDDDDEDHFVVEKAKAQSGQLKASTANETVVGTVNSNALHYTVSYTPGFEEGEQLSVLGENYEVTDIASTNKVKLGSTMTESGLTKGESYTHGPYTVEVADVDSGNGKVFVRISKDESVLKSTSLSQGQSVAVSNGAFNVTATTIFFGTETHITLDSTYTNTVVTQGETSPFDAGYKATNVDAETSGTATISGFTLKSTNTTAANAASSDSASDVPQLSAGDTFQGPQDYFGVTYQGLTSEATETATVKDKRMVTYKDVEGFEHTLDLDKVSAVSGNDTAISGGGTEINSTDTYYTDISGHPVTIKTTNNGASSGGVEDSVKLSYKTWSVTLDSNQKTVDQATGYGFRVNAEITGSEANTGDNADELVIYTSHDDVVDTQYHSNLTVGSNSNVEVYESDSDGTADFEVEYDGNTADANVEGVDDNPGDENGGPVDGTNWYLDSKNTDRRSSFGTVVSAGSSISPVTLTLPEKKLQAQFALGEVTTSGGESQTSYQPTGWPDAAALDSEVTTSQRQSENLILVGGPAVNSLTKELANAGDTWTQQDYMNNSDVGVLDLVNNAFAQGEHALVVAGAQAEDTRTASQYLSNYEQHSSVLEGKQTVQISTQTQSVVQ
ncbi:MAG: S-layer protein [Candidatus Nanohaloarchaea archaeon]